jgi:hypothetical protein
LAGGGSNGQVPNTWLFAKIISNLTTFTPILRHHCL